MERPPAARARRHKREHDGELPNAGSAAARYRLLRSTAAEQRAAARRAPSTIAASFCHTMSSMTVENPAELKPQSVPAIRRRGSSSDRDANEPVGHRVGVLDVVRRCVDDAGNELGFRQRLH